MDVFGGYGQDLEDNIGKIFEEKVDIRTVIKNMQKVSSIEHCEPLKNIQNSFRFQHSTKMQPPVCLLPLPCFPRATTGCLSLGESSDVYNNKNVTTEK